MRAVLPVDVGVGQPQIRFVDEQRRLQRVPGRLAAQLAAGKPAQFAVDERNQAVVGGLVAASPLVEQVHDFGGVFHLAGRTAGGTSRWASVQFVTRRMGWTRLSEHADDQQQRRRGQPRLQPRLAAGAGEEQRQRGEAPQPP